MRLPSVSILLLGLFGAFSSGAFAQTTTAPNPFGTPAQTSPAQTAPAAKKPRATRAAEAPKAGQFTSEADAKASCPGDSVVWVNTGTKVYHHAGAATYGKTKRGAYMCEKDTAAAGFRAAKNEKR
jgi:hypothetical protein